MEIIVNGTVRQAGDGQTVQALLEELRLNPNTTIVELNRAVIDRTSYSTTPLARGDRLELVRIVGGG